jgi:uncharacterized RDD family membrane protein YckC
MAMEQRPRFEREIEELLRDIDDFPVESRAPKPREAGLAARLSVFLLEVLRSIDSGKLALTGLAILLLGALSRNVLGGLGQGLIIAGAIILIGSYALYFTGRRTGRYRKRWRGRDIEFDREPSAVERWVDHLLHRLRGRR